MKTAMQEHIEHLRIIQNMVKEKSLDKDLTETINETLEGAIENAESFIEKEKQQIIESFKIGLNSDCLQEQNEQFFAEEYYNKTFKS